MMGGIKVTVTALLIDVGVSSLVEEYQSADVYDAWSDDDTDYRIDCSDGSGEIMWNKKANKNPLVQYVYPKS